MATRLEHIDLATIPQTHKGDFRSGWYKHPSGVYLSPLAIAKHRMAGPPPTQFTYERWRHGGWYVYETMWPNVRMRMPVTQLRRPQMAHSLRSPAI